MTRGGVNPRVFSAERAPGHRWKPRLRGVDTTHPPPWTIIMSIGRRLAELRHQRGQTQRTISSATGLAVSYLSRLENGRIIPSIGTLSKIASALGVPITAFFQTEETPSSPPSCPVSLSGRCVLEVSGASPRSGKGKGGERYTDEQLELLRMWNYLLHCGDQRILSALTVMLDSLMLYAREGSTKGGGDSRDMRSITPRERCSTSPAPPAEGLHRGR